LAPGICNASDECHPGAHRQIRLTRRQSNPGDLLQPKHQGAESSDEHCASDERVRTDGRGTKTWHSVKVKWVAAASVAATNACAPMVAAPALV
jgi:hypothetical protein